VRLACLVRIGRFASDSRQAAGGGGLPATPGSTVEILIATPRCGREVDGHASECSNQIRSFCSTCFSSSAAPLSSGSVQCWHTLCCFDGISATDRSALLHQHTAAARSFYCFACFHKAVEQQQRAAATVAQGRQPGKPPFPGTRSTIASVCFSDLQARDHQQRASRGLVQVQVTRKKGQPNLALTRPWSIQVPGRFSRPGSSPIKVASSKPPPPLSVGEGERLDCRPLLLIDGAPPRAPHLHQSSHTIQSLVFSPISTRTPPSPPRHVPVR
jgi:hypothetical protein